VQTHTLDLLEFPKVRAALARHAGFSAGRELALALEPLADLNQVRWNQAVTAEARLLLELKGGVTIGGARDVRPSIRRASLGGILETTELLDLAATLASARVLRATIGGVANQIPNLADIARQITVRGDLEEDISRCINDHGEVTDYASTALGRIRADMRTAHGRVVERLNSILRSSSYRTIIQDPIITIRDGRYVIPIKAEAKGQFPSIVHDQSASGATLFVEPLATVELNNQWRRLQLAEREEIAEILRGFSERVGASADDLILNVDALAQLDLALAKSHYAASLRAVEPILVHPDSPDPESSLELQLLNARHPLLAGKVVPITVRLGGEFRILVVTGPNTGGKTVALKTLGLLTAMAQAGLQIPADVGSRVRVFDEIFADIGDEQSIEQSLSTFSSHLTHIIGIIQEANENSLVLLDELGAGTDPTEGSALARAILDHFLTNQVVVMGTTHYSQIKVYAHATPGVANASVEFDVQTLSPTYRLTIGLPGRSNALAIASRLGLPSHIIDSARELLSSGDIQIEQMLEHIQAERDRAVSDRDELERARRKIAAKEEELRRRLRSIERERATMFRTARQELELEVRAIRQRLQEATAALEAPASNPTSINQLASDLRVVEKEMIDRRERDRQAALPRPEPVTVAKDASFRPGDAVRLRSIDLAGTLLAIDASGVAEVQLGNFKTRVAADDLKREASPVVSRGGVSYVISSTIDQAPSTQIDLRGWRADQVAPEVDKYLNQAYLAGLPYVRIVHGKGTGALRQVVREYLDGHPLVRSFETADPREGGEGVTVAVLGG
jgi:DNA mismatch repair protein MutS2